MKCMFWTNEKLSLMVAWSSSVAMSCFKVQSSIGHLVCVNSSIWLVGGRRHRSDPAFYTAVIVFDERIKGTVLVAAMRIFGNEPECQNNLVWTTQGSMFKLFALGENIKSSDWTWNLFSCIFFPFKMSSIIVLMHGMYGDQQQCSMVFLIRCAASGERCLSSSLRLACKDNDD